MNKFWVAVLAGTGGVIVGLLIARQYAQATVASDIHTALSKVGLGGGTVETLVSALVLPQVG